MASWSTSDKGKGKCETEKGKGKGTDHEPFQGKGKGKTEKGKGKCKRILSVITGRISELAVSGWEEEDSDGASRLWEDGWATDGDEWVFYGYSDHDARSSALWHERCKGWGKNKGKVDEGQNKGELSKGQNKGEGCELSEGQNKGELSKGKNKGEGKLER
jgi:hypothetical protein